ncbi:atherin-like [Elephas maximus indicus]|uniref:atherin-like n=1 Tax=Elephas maximus indicus TaxID=99487 RepID=UPI0021164D4E|nr:atherin-like [Elephas maximus indicus]
MYPCLSERWPNKPAAGLALHAAPPETGLTLFATARDSAARPPGACLLATARRAPGPGAPSRPPALARPPPFRAGPTQISMPSPELSRSGGGGAGRRRLGTEAAGAQRTSQLRRTARWPAGGGSPVAGLGGRAARFVSVSSFKSHQKAAHSHLHKKNKRVGKSRPHAGPPPARGPASLPLAAWLGAPSPRVLHPMDPGLAGARRRGSRKESLTRFW